MKYTLSVIFFLGAIRISFSQATTFEKTFLHSKYEDARGIAQLPSGEIVVTGLEKGSIDSLGSMYLMKLDNMGVPKWQKYYDLKGEDGGNHLLISHSQNILLTGHLSAANGECDGYLVLTDLEGNAIWKSKIGDIYDDVLSASTEAPDGKIYAVGRTENFGATDMDMLLHICDQDGNAIDNINLGTNNYDYATSVIYTKDNQILISGISVGPDNSWTNALIIKCDLNGNIIWKKEFKYPGSNAANKVIQLDNGNYLIVGQKQENTGIFAWMCELNPTGEIVKEKVFDKKNNCEFNTIIDLNNGKFIGVGHRPTELDSNSDLWICLLNEHGEILNEFDYNSQYYDIPFSSVIGHDQFLYIAGKQRFMNSMSQSFIIKSNLMGSLGTVISDAEFTSKVYPNPFNRMCTFSTPGNYQLKEIKIYDISGKLVVHKNYAIDEIVINLETNQKGIYTYQILDIHSNKLINGLIMSQ